MKAILEFNLPEEEAEFKQAANAGDMYCAIFEFSQYLRKKLKYEDLSEQEKKTIEKNEEQCTIHSVMPRFSKIIDKWLTIRDESEDRFWHEPSEEDSFFPKYVMRMMREINEEMPKPMLDKIKSNEICAMGHVDYAHKFALYCAELYLNEA